MTDREAFTRRILEEPAEDTHRLVFADWLEEHGDQPADAARARFIRHQIAEAHHNAHVFYPAFENMRREWEGRYGAATQNDPMRPERCPAHGGAYRDAFYKSRLLATQTRLMLEKYAAEWLGDLPRAILPPEYYAWRDVKTKKRVPPEIVVRRDDWRDWIEFTQESPRDNSQMRTGPLFRFRRGFINQLSYHDFYHDFGKQQLIDVFSRHPIVSVRGTREPVEYRRLLGCDDPYWLWAHSANPESLTPANMIPTRVWELLPHRKLVEGEYPDRQSAVADFQWACVALGRELAGLPMLAKPPVPPHPDVKKLKPRKAPT